MAPLLVWHAIESMQRSAEECLAGRLAVNSTPRNSMVIGPEGVRWLGGDRSPLIVDHGSAPTTHKGARRRILNDKSRGSDQ